MTYEHIAREAIAWIGDMAKCHEDSDFFTEMTNKLNGANPTMNKQEFILNNITEMVRAGRVEGLPKLAADLAEVYDVSCDVLSTEELQHCTVTIPQFDGEAPVQKPQPHHADYVAPLTDVPTAPREATEPTPIVDEVPTAPTAPVADAPTEPTPPSERTHDDWGLPFSDEWHVSTRNTAKPGYFKRKPGTNEEQYAAFVQNCVTEATAAGTFTGPDNWATVSRLSKYLDPVQATPDAPQVVDAPTLQPQAETVGQAMHTGVTVDAPTEPTPAVEAAPVAPVGASASSEIPNMSEMMTAHMGVCQGFGVTDSRHKAVLERCEAANIMMITDDKKAWFVNASKAVLEQLEVIKADPSGEILKTVLDSVTA
ncbi:hypothetical protein SIPHO075v1_p0073 [Vibrio phage PS65A.1]|nr:hypothetical protein SIPHO075v1_p0073 [Vibrio phage PS65A.1]